MSSTRQRGVEFHDFSIIKTVASDMTQHLHLWPIYHLVLTVLISFSLRLPQRTADHSTSRISLNLTKQSSLQRILVFHFSGHPSPVLLKNGKHSQREIYKPPFLLSKIFNDPKLQQHQSNPLLLSHHESRPRNLYVLFHYPLLSSCFSSLPLDVISNAGTSLNIELKNGMFYSYFH